MPKKAGNPNWKKGISANPKGRPKGSGSQLPQLLEAIKRVEKKLKLDYFEIMVLRSLHEPSVMNAIARKLIPDLKAVEITGQEGGTIKIIVTKEP